MEEVIRIHAMKVYYSNVHNVTNKGCIGNLHCEYFQEGKGKNNILLILGENILLAHTEMLLLIRCIILKC